MGHVDTLEKPAAAAAAAAPVAAAAAAAVRVAPESEHLGDSLIAFWEMDCTTGLIQLSSMWSLLLGGPKRPTVLRSDQMMDLVPAEERHMISQGLRELFAGRESYSVEHRVRRLDGGYLWVQCDGRVAERDPQGRVVRVSGINRDVTRRRETEHELRLARDAADAASRAKTEFLATMSHEIRTPLNGIVGLAKLLLDEPLGDSAKRHAELIDNSAQALLALVNDILDVSKIEAGQMTLEEVPFDLHELVQDLATLYRLRASEKSLLFRFNLDDEVPRHVCSDPVRVRQILSNLLGNALKFTEHGWIGLHVGIEDTPAGTVMKFVVRDTGVGISKEAQERLFQPFTQADSSTSRRFGGTGLGLSIVRQLCARMGGSVAMHSSEGNGSRFAVTLPCTPAAAAAQPSSYISETLPAPPAARILVAEDNSTNQVVALGMLRKLGYTDVAIAPDGLRALKMGRTGQYDLILMDCQMPGMDGYEATRKLREAGCTSVIVAMTASAIQGDRERCIAAGMDDYISKPIALKSFGELLGRWVLGKAGRSAPAPLGTEPAAFDADGLQDRLGDDPDLVEAAMGSFLEATPKLLARLARAVETQDRPQIRLLAHTAKGSGSMISATAFAAAAGSMEEGAAVLPHEELVNLLWRVRAGFEAFVRAARPLQLQSLPTVPAALA